MPLLRLLPTTPRLVTFSRLPTSRRRFVFEKVVTAGLSATPEVYIIVNARLELRLWTISRWLVSSFSLKASGGEFRASA